MSENDDLKELFKALTASTKKRIAPKAEDDTRKGVGLAGSETSGEEASTEKTKAFQDDPIGKAKEEIGLDLLARIRKIVPSAVSLAWIVFAFAVIVIVSSLLFLWCSYVYSIWDKPEEILPLLVKVRDLAAATALGALLTYTRLRR